MINLRFPKFIAIQICVTTIVFRRIVFRRSNKLSKDDYMLMRNSNGKARRNNTRDKAKYKTNKKVNNKSISK